MPVEARPLVAGALALVGLVAFVVALERARGQHPDARIAAVLAGLALVLAAVSIANLLAEP